ncbi:MAG: class I SAM-dependent methyltransferase [Gammaproteobacteria bacterium]
MYLNKQPYKINFMIRHSQNNKLKIESPWIAIDYRLNQYIAFRIFKNVFKKCGNFINFCWHYLKDKNKSLKCVDTYTKYAFLKHEDKFCFFKAFVSNPRLTGAIYPSSTYLVKEMVSHVFQENDGIVIELGAGTGVVTAALLQSGINPKNIIAIEYSSELIKKLRTRFPTIQIIEGNAANLSMLLNNEKRTINTIISSLPLRSLPFPVTKAILEEIRNVLSLGGRYIQFTYSFQKDSFYSLNNFKKIVSNRVWINLPPARVDVWIKKEYSVLRTQKI